MTTLEEPKHSEGQQDQSKPGDLETKKTIVEETQVHSKSGDMELEKTIIRTAERRLTTTVLVGLIGALLVTICHHLFLFIIDGRPAQAQLWIKNASNAFSQVVVLFMGLIAASSLTQSVRSMNTALYLLTSYQDLVGIVEGVHPNISHRQPLLPSITVLRFLRRHAEKAPVHPTFGNFSRHSSTGPSEHLCAKLAHHGHQPWD